MKKSSAGLILTAILFIAIQSLNALPSVYGTHGFYRTVSAYVPPAGSYSFFISTLYQQALIEDSLRFIFEEAEIDTALLVRDREHYLDGAAEFGMTLTDNVEIAMTVTYLVNAYQFEQVHVRRDYVGIMDLIWGFGSVRPAVKYGRDINEWVTVGGMVWAGIPLGQTVPDTIGDYDGYWQAGDLRLQVRRPFLSGSDSWGFLTLLSSSYMDFQGNLNLGYSHYRQEYSDSVLGDVSQSDGALDLGLGIGYRAPQAILFMEYSVRSFLSRRGDEGYSAPSRLTGGVRLFDETGAYLDIVGEMGLSEYERTEADPYETGKLPIPGGVPGDWGVMLGLGFDTQLSAIGGERTEGIGTVAGTVADAETGQPLHAQVSFPGNAISPTVTDSTTGFFTAPVTSGTVILRAEAEGYIPASATLVVEDGGTVANDFRLNSAEPELSEGTVTGTVTDSGTGQPVPADIVVQGTDVTASASSSGTFQLQLPQGAASLRASADGYLQQVKTVSVTPGQTATVDFSLNTSLESGETLSFANIYFDSGSATLQPNSYSVLDQVVEMLRNNSEVDVQIVGHTDSDGSSSYNMDLSNRRAQSVMNYLVQSGISSARLSTAGMGESQPVASNSTPQGKAQNRRIEFRIL
ncbi:MAG: OmpA family protein [Candidatus Aegiribacteria sp.]|nr:OmpA family protein [Candidatus Aegiribacteria sp.]